MDDKRRYQAKGVKGGKKAKVEGGPHLSEAVQLSWHKGPVAGVLG